MMIWDYINAMENKDYVALSKCFSENCRLFDYCPGNIGQENSSSTASGPSIC